MHTNIFYSHNLLGMIKTKIQKAIALAWIVAITATSFGSTFAATIIGTGSVTGDASFDTNIIWDDNFPGTATGTVTDVIIKARILPALNMEISTGSIDLGILTAGVASAGSLFIEVGTNAESGVSITARSQSGGLTNLADDTVKLQNNAGGLVGGVVFDDLIDESYTFASTAWATDSAALGFTLGADLGAVEVNNDTSEHIIYSTNKGEPSAAIDDVEFTVSVTSDADSLAGDYEDYVTFTVVGNF